MASTDPLFPPGLRVSVGEFAPDPQTGITQNVEVSSVPAPDPADLSPEDAIIEIRSAAVSWVDLLMTSGQYQHQPRLPYCPGLEYSGVVCWVGAAVSKKAASVGDEVFVDCFSAGPRTSGPYQSFGGYASYAVAPAKALRPIPKGFTFDQACNFAGNYETAYHCLIACGELQAGETILIHGASGSTGLAAVQIAKLLGATVIATGRSKEKLKVVEEHGADHIITLSRDAAGDLTPFREEVKALTGGKGVDVVYDGVGGDISTESLRCMRFGARFLIVGWASTPNVAQGRGQRGAPNANTLPTNRILIKGLKVLGCPTIIATGVDPSLRIDRLKQLNQWVTQGHLRPYVSHTFPLEEASAAMLAKWKGEIIGGCVLHPPLLS